jgi:hypothetical protein
MKSVSPLLALIASTAFAFGQSKGATDYLNEPEKYEARTSLYHVLTSGDLLASLKTRQT